MSHLILIKRYPASHNIEMNSTVQIHQTKRDIANVFQTILKDLRYNPVGKELILSKTEWAVIEPAEDEDQYRVRFFNDSTTTGFIFSRSAAILLEQLVEMGYQSLDIGALDRARSNANWDENLQALQQTDVLPSPGEYEEFHLLSEQEFQQAYMFHVDIRGHRVGRSESNRQAILEHGFNSNFPNVFNAFHFTSQADLGFNLALNQHVYLVPISEVDARKKHSLKVKDGWKPKQYEVVQINDLSKTMYQHYLESVEAYFGRKCFMNKVDLKPSLHSKELMSNEELLEISALEEAMFDSEDRKIKGALLLNSNVQRGQMEFGKIQFAHPSQSTKFQNWFKNSVFKNADGTPQVLYHGTAADFTVFSTEKGGGTGHTTSKIGYWFSGEPEIASKFAQFCVGAPAIMPVYLSIQNPKIYGPLSKDEQSKREEEIKQTQIVIDHDQKHLEALKVTLQNLDFSDIMQKSPIYQRLKLDEAATVERLQVSKLRIWELSATDPFHQMRCDLDEHTRYLNGMNNRRGAHAAHFAASSVDVAGFHEQLKKQGFDGIVIRDTEVDAIDDHTVTTQIIAFEPNQIKSVIGNNGEFSDDPDIRFSFNNSTGDEASLRLMELDQLNAITTLASYFGTRVGLIQFNQKSGSNPEGAYFNRTLWLNVDSSMPLVRVFGHEFLHHLRACRPDLYERLEEVLTPILDQSKIRGLNSKYRDMNHDAQMEELIAHEFSIQFKEKEFWDLLANKDPSLFRDLAIFIKDILSDLKAIFLDTAHIEFSSDVSLAREAIADAVVEFSRGQYERRVEVEIPAADF